MNHNPRDRFVIGSLLAGALLLGTSGCSDEAAPAAAGSPTASPAASPTAGPPASDGVTVISPGRPGEAATTGPVEPVDPAGWNDADTAFVQMMVPHHVQALQMAHLAEQHAVQPAVRRLARRIAAAQGPEVQLMSTWLTEQGLQPADMDQMDAMDEMDTGSMTGMLTGEEMAALAAARGATFDRLFLEGMVRHHQGAVEMASDVAVAGSDVRVAELAADVTLTQTAEIDRMREVLALPVP